MDKAVLIAHYNKPLYWANHLKVNKVFIYSANPEFIEYTQVKNRGNDSSHYLSFILDHYDNLPERTVFCHDHERNWTQEHPLPKIINHLNWNVSKYFSICSRHNFWYAIPYDSKPEHIAAMKRSWHILEKYIPYPEKLMFFAGTQFCVHRDLILQYPKEFYQNCREWVYTTNEAGWFIGRFFEYTWHYIFTGNPIEQDLKYMI